MINNYIEYSKEVEEAIKNKKAIVALESTIISHGMPYPENVKTAMECERIVRENGSVPATIAILNGKLKIGLSEEELNFLGKEGTKISKTSRRDIAYNVANKKFVGNNSKLRNMNIIRSKIESLKGEEMKLGLNYRAVAVNGRITLERNKARQEEIIGAIQATNGQPLRLWARFEHTLQYLLCLIIDRH